MTRETVPADVRAAAEALVRSMLDSDSAAPLPPAQAALADTYTRHLPAALSAADAARAKIAGDVVEWLIEVAEQLEEGMDLPPDELALQSREAATLITTLQARIAALEAERDTARADALREAATMGRGEFIKCNQRADNAQNAADGDERVWRIAACTARIVEDAILALIEKEAAR